MSVQVTELVQAFRFQVHLTRSLPGRTLAPPPQLGASGGGSTAPPAPVSGGSRTGAAATAPVGGASSQGGGDRLGDGGFQECGGLVLDADLHDVLEGGANDTTVRRLGRVKHSPIVLTRGMVVATAAGPADVGLWSWMSAMLSGQVPVPRYDGRIEVLDPTFGRVVARWTFVRGLPLKVVGPSLHAVTGAVAVEELHIAHEGLLLEPSP
ncbi:phage tail protein [Nocardioides sp. zg-1230]|uniref:phage tail protein n=1 Tax=Nocardioides sp. zg-1230 TaxID=2736601 RepID=UPI001557D504|nr:phage tail protein [Nocardioides sp. zg-1230]NPC44583.1 phage tail protein [Nocardioides sp. zg-1230]